MTAVERTCACALSTASRISARSASVPDGGRGQIGAGGAGPLERMLVDVAAVDRAFQNAVADAGQRQLHDDVGRRRPAAPAGLIRSTTRVGRRGGPSLMICSTSPCETLPRVCVDVSRPGGRASRPATWPTWRWPTRGADIRWRCSAAAPRGLERLTYADDRRRRRRCTRVRCSVALAVAGTRGSAPPRGADRVDGRGHGRATFVALGGTSLARTGVRMADLLSPRRRRRRAGGCCRRCADATRPRWTPTGWPAPRWSRSPRTPPTHRWRRCCGPRSAGCPRCWCTAVPTPSTR